MIKAILLDIEGTTTPIDFVHETLFPFALKRIGDYVEANFGQLAKEISDLKSEHLSDAAYDAPFDDGSPSSVSGYLRYLIEVDRKSTPLKTIQGNIWQLGYESNELISEVFDDVPPAFERWQMKGHAIAIYSSGSVLAQKNLFKYTKFGDLTPAISRYFDTRTGLKHDAWSYRRIGEMLDLPTAVILFVSDIPSELAAARDAGLSPLLSVRPGNAPVENDHDWNVITSFDSLG